MARELNLAPDYSPINSGVLAVHPLAPETTLVGESPATSVVVEGVVSTVPFEGQQEIREYEVEVEYRPDEVVLEDSSFEEYLISFKNAKITQESMTQVIKYHLTHALGTGDIFVEVHRGKRTEWTSKKTRIGAL